MTHENGADADASYAESLHALIHPRQQPPPDVSCRTGAADAGGDSSDDEVHPPKRGTQRRVVDSSDEEEEEEEDSSDAEDDSSGAEGGEGGAEMAAREEGDAGQRYAVERLLGRRVALGRAAGDSHRKGTILYRVLWQGLDESDASWEPMSYLTKDLVEAYDRQHTDSAQPATASVEDID